jgi:hypothetical protein
VCSQRGRTGVGRKCVVGIPGPDRIEVGGKLRKSLSPLPQARDPVEILPGLARLLGAEVVTPCAGVRLDIDDRFRFCQECFQQQRGDGVLEDIGMIAGVKAVEIA